MSDTNETNRMNERRRNMGLPPITARASKPTRQLTTEDIREYLEEIKAIAEKLFPDEIDRDTYIKSARNKVKEELLTEKVQLTDDDQVLILDKITGKVKTTKVNNIKSKQTDELKSTSKDFFKNKSQDLSNSSPEVFKLFDLIKKDKERSNRDRILDNIRAGKNVEKLETLSTSLDSFLHEQQITTKLLNQLKTKIVGSSATGGIGGIGGTRGRGGIGSSILRGIVNNPGIALLGGIGAARVIGGIMSGGTAPSTPPLAEEVITGGAGGPRVQAQNPQGELNEELRSMVREGQLTREQANNISIRSLTGEITPEEAREEVRSLLLASATMPSPPAVDPGVSVPPVSQPAAAPSSNSETAPLMAASPDGADVDALGLRPESTQQPINSTEQQIPEDATPVRLDGRVVGYMPAGGGPTVTFTDNDRQALEIVRAQVIGSQLTTPPAATPTTTAGIRTRDFEARTSQTATPVVPDIDRVSIESEQEIYNRLLQEQPESFRDDVDVQNNLRDEARLTTQARRREARESTPQSLVSQTQARPVIANDATATPTQQPSLTSLAGGIRPTGPNLEASGDNLRSTAVQIGLLPDINAPGRVTGRSEGNVVTEVTVGNQTVNLYDQGLLNDEQRQRVDDARRLRRLMSGQGRLSPEAAKDEDNFLDTLRMRPSSRQNRVTAQTSPADATPAVVDIAAAPPAAISVRSNDQNAARVPVAEVPAVTTTVPTVVVQRRTNIASTENNNQEQILREAAVRAGLIPNINAPGRITGKLEGNTAVEVTAGNRTINLYDQGLLDDEQRQRVDSARQLRTMMSGQQRANPGVTVAEDNDLINSLAPNARRSTLATRSIATPIAPTPTPDAEPQTTSSFRTLDASNISRRDNFDQSDITTATSPAGGFEFANENIAQPSVTAVARSQPMTEQINTNVDEELLVNTAVNEREALSKEYESNPLLFSNRNLVLRAKKVTFASDDIEFKLPAQSATAQRVPSGGGESPVANLMTPPPSVSGSGSSGSGSGSTSAGGASAEGSGSQQLTTGQASATSTAADTSGLSFAPGVDPRINRDIAQKIKQIESTFGKSLTITSGFRDEQRNARAGGARNSAHTRANAIDIQFRGNQEETNKLIEVASAAGIGGIGVYRPGWLHLDTESKRVWGPDFTARSIPEWAKDTLQAHMSGQIRRSPTAESSASGSDATPITASESSTPSTTGAPGSDGGGTGDATGDATPVAAAGSGAPDVSTPTATAVPDVTPSAESSAPAAQMLSAPSADGAAVDGASRDNAMAERSPAPASAPNVIDMSGGAGNPSTPPPIYNSSDPNDPGLVEPEDAAERYARLFDMAA
jgi:hypothetical protein